MEARCACTAAKSSDFDGERGITANDAADTAPDATRLIGVSREGRMNDYEQAIAYQDRQLALALLCLPAQFIPGIAETPEACYKRRLYELGVIPGRYGYAF